MKKYKAIFFDMDGTLVPMDMHDFTYGYFTFLAKKLSKYGIEPKKLVDSIWAGTAEMVKNDGSRTNEEVFWECFEKKSGFSKAQVGEDCEDFYGNEFKEAVIFTKPNELAKEAVKIAHEKAPIVALATNPLFPMVGQVTRMNWVGLQPSDFDLVTCYEKDCFSKPNPKFFLSVCEQLGVDPSECLAIGNDEKEDMYAAKEAGIDGYLVTDCLIECPEHPFDGPRGTFEDLIEYLKNL